MVSLSSACQEAVNLHKLCNELGRIQTSPTVMYEDCESAVALSKENRFRNRSKHISLRWAYVTERQRPHVAAVRVVFVSRRIMLADIFTSPRPAASFLPFRNSILGYPSQSHTMSPQNNISSYHATYTYNTCPQAIPLSLVCKMLVLVVMSYSVYTLEIVI